MVKNETVARFEQVLITRCRFYKSVFKICRFQNLPAKNCRFRVNGRPIRHICHRFQNVPASSDRSLDFAIDFVETSFDAPIVLSQDRPSGH